MGLTMLNQNGLFSLDELKKKNASWNFLRGEHDFKVCGYGWYPRVLRWESKKFVQLAKFPLTWKYLCKPEDALNFCVTDTIRCRMLFGRPEKVLSLWKELICPLGGCWITLKSWAGPVFICHGNLSCSNNMYWLWLQYWKLTHRILQNNVTDTFASIYINTSPKRFAHTCNHTPACPPAPLLIAT